MGRHVSATGPAPIQCPFRPLGSFVKGVGPPPDAGQLATYLQRLRGYGFDASPILRKFLACGVPLTEDLVRLTTCLKVELLHNLVGAIVDPIESP